jgi:hypothetical protein
MNKVPSTYFLFPLCITIHWPTHVFFPWCTRETCASIPSSRNSTLTMDLLWSIVSVLFLFIQAMTSQYFGRQLLAQFLWSTKATSFSRLWTYKVHIRFCGAYSRNKKMKMTLISVWNFKKAMVQPIKQQAMYNCHYDQLDQSLHKRFYNYLPKRLHRSIQDEIQKTRMFPLKKPFTQSSCGWFCELLELPNVHGCKSWLPNIPLSSPCWFCQPIPWLEHMSRSEYCMQLFYVVSDMKLMYFNYLKII